MTYFSTPLIREVRGGDLDDLVALAQRAAAGMTTFFPDPRLLGERIERSLSGEAPLLVMIDGDDADSDATVIGTAGMFARVGDAARAIPFYAYRLEKSVQRSESLGIHRTTETLHLVELYDGPTEIGTLFVHPEHRAGRRGRALSFSRFLLMAGQPRRYQNQVIAEMRGLLDKNSQSPFWDGLGKHFFQVPFTEADAHSALDKTFIAELMPVHPIYVALLSREAQTAIGRVHPNTEPAKRLLGSEGFHFAGMIDIFDGGPVVRCDLAAIRTIRESRVVTVAGFLDASDHVPDGVSITLIATLGGPFLCRAADAEVRGNEVWMHASIAESLRVERGDKVRVSPLLQNQAADY
ncbi:MAG: arginine N-succinyltransferase [Planctomycetota bacterium]